MALKITEKILNENKDDPNLLTTLKDDIDYSQKLYIHTDNSLKSIIKFIYWYYATILTAILAILNFSNFAALHDFDKIYYISISVFYFSILSLTVTYMIYESLKQYILKEITFASLTTSKYQLDEVYGYESKKFTIFQGKDDKLKNIVYKMYREINRILIFACTFFIFFTTFLLSCYEVFPKNTSLFEFGLITFLFTFSGVLCIYSLNYVSKFENEVNKLEIELHDLLNTVDSENKENKEENSEK